MPAGPLREKMFNNLWRKNNKIIKSLYLTKKSIIDFWNNFANSCNVVTSSQPKDHKQMKYFQTISGWIRHVFFQKLSHSHLFLVFTTQSHKNIQKHHLDKQVSRNQYIWLTKTVVKNPLKFSNSWKPKKKMIKGFALRYFYQFLLFSI